MLLQMRVPTSMTDWCISALTRSSRRSLPLASISVAMCERRSRVSGSTIWYSSSMPSVKDGRMLTSDDESKRNTWGGLGGKGSVCRVGTPGGRPRIYADEHGFRTGNGKGEIQGSLHCASLRSRDD